MIAMYVFLAIVAFMSYQDGNWILGSLTVFMWLAYHWSNMTEKKMLAAADLTPEQKRRAAAAKKS